MKVIHSVDFGEWQEVVDKCEHATFFHTPTWSRILTQAFPELEIATKKFVLPNGSKVILPLISVKRSRGFLKSYHSMIPGVYGGVIADGKITQNEIDRIFTSLKKTSFADFSIMSSPFFDHVLPSKFRLALDFTHILKLDVDEDKLWENYKYSVRKQINKALRAGVKYKEASDFDEWREYFIIYQQALKRWGDKATSNYPLSLFERMFETKNQNVKLWLVIYDKQIVGGNLNFYHNKHCVEWHASFLREHLKYGTRNFLVHNIILDAKSKGYKYYDFNPSGGHSGTARFKETFRPEKVVVRRWKWQNPLVRIANNTKRKIFRALSF